MGWIDRTTKKRIAKLDEHPEINIFPILFPILV